MKWTDKIKYEEDLNRVSQTEAFLKNIRIREANWIGHILRRDCLRNFIVERNIYERIG